MNNIQFFQQTSSHGYPTGHHDNVVSYLSLQNEHKENQFNPQSIDTWLCLITFVLTIACVMLSPKVPIIKPLPLIKALVSRIKNKLSSDDSKQSRRNLSFDNSSKTLQSTMHDQVSEEIDTRDEKIDLDETNGRDSLDLQTGRPSLEVLISRPITETESEIRNMDFRGSTSTAKQNILFEMKDHFKHFVYWVSLDLSLAPIIAIIFLAFTGTLSLEGFLIGITGNEYLKPYTILIIFLALTYMCISIDTTGLFEWIANMIVIYANNSGHVLFIGIMIFSSILTCLVTSNDTVILTLIPIVCYMTMSSENMNPLPYIIGIYFMANIWGVGLQTGSTTNLIVSQAIGLDFLMYLKWMIIPAISVGIFSILFTYAVFYKSIPRTIYNKKRAYDDHENNEDLSIQNKRSPNISKVEANKLNGHDGVEIDEELNDVELSSTKPISEQIDNDGDHDDDDEKKEFDSRKECKNEKKSKSQNELKILISPKDNRYQKLDHTQESPIRRAPTPTISNQFLNKDAVKIEKNEAVEFKETKASKMVPPLRNKFYAICKMAILLLCLCALAISSALRVENWILTIIFLMIFIVLDMIHDITQFGKYLLKKRGWFGGSQNVEHSPQQYHVMTSSFMVKSLYNMPWSIVPFAIGMFVLVHTLKSQGITKMIAHHITWLMRVVGGTEGLNKEQLQKMNFIQHLRATGSSVFVMTYLSSMACNVLNNQPMAIFFTEIVKDSEYVLATKAATIGSQLSVVIGSNLGANLTPIGSLAGLLIISLLRRYDHPSINAISFFTLVKYGLILIPIATLVPCLVLTSQLMFFL